MIGFTSPPGASGVTIAGTEVWNPESLSAPAGSAPAAATAATKAARTNSLFLITLPFCCLSPLLLRAAASLNRLARRQQECQEGSGIAAHPGVAPVRSLLQLERARVGERPQAAVPDQHLVDAADAAAVRRVDGDAESRGLAVHRPAGRDDEVGERDQALRVDGRVGDDQR